MMNVNQSVLASAVINITGNTQGFEYAISQTKKQMQGFMVFANAIGGRTGGLLANALTTGAMGPALKSVLGSKVGGKVSGFLDRHGLTENATGDVARSMDRAKRLFDIDTMTHRITGSRIGLGSMYNGRILNTPQDVKEARIRHAATRPKMETYTHGIVARAAASAQSLAMFYTKVGIAAAVFKTLAESGMELDQKLRRASRIFGSSINTAMGGYGGIGVANMSASQFAAGASGIGQELNMSGVGHKQSAGMSSVLANQAGQLAAQWGAEFEDVAGSMQSAIGGSNKAMEQFGVILSDDLVRAYAFNNGMIRQGEVMSNSIAAQARYALILNQTNEALKGGSSNVFNLKYQWDTFTSGLSTALEKLGVPLAKATAGVLAFVNATAKYAAGSFELTGGGLLGAAGTALDYATGGEEAKKNEDLRATAKDDAARADDVIRRERARQSSNVGYHRPEDFYNHIQKGIFGDPVEFQKRTADLMHEFLIVSKEQRDILRSFGYKAVDGSALLAPH